MVGDILKKIVSGFFGGIVRTMLTIALIVTAGWGLWQYSNYRDATELLAQRDSQIEMLEDEVARKEKRLKHFGDIAAQREERKDAWMEEALKWKNRMAELIERDEDVAEWADNLYRAPD